VRIVFVTSRFPYPVEKGDKLRAYHQLRLLSQHHEVHLVALTHHRLEEKDIEAMRPFCASIKVFRISLWLLPIHLLLGWLEGLPLQVSYFYDRTIKRDIQYHIIGLDPDHVICQLIRATPHVRSLAFPKTLDYMDVFSVGMEQLAERLKPFGFLIRWEAARLARFERTIYKDFDRHTIISDQDRQRLNLASTERVVVVPNGVDPAFFNYTKVIDPRFDIVFVGNLGYAPNVHAAKFLVKTLHPALKASKIPCKILLAGARPGKSVLNLEQPDAVKVKGWVDDIREAYADGHIFVAPMFTGLGLQNKILEAMAMGLPCVTTSMVNNAIGAIPDEEILVADTLQAFVNHIARLTMDHDYRNQIAEAGRSFVVKNYQWEDQVAKLEAVLVNNKVYT
jgi:sugar transferase (PEP-CTERM/EpsH1 system associated)